MGKSKYEATIDQLRSLANGSLYHSVNETGGAVKVMNKVEVKHTSLSTIPSCVQFQKVLDDAMDLYKEVLDGIKADVEKFHEALHDTANTMEKNDESAATGIAAISKKINGPLATQSRGQRAYRKHRSLHDGKVEDAPNVTPPTAAPGHPGTSATPTSSTSATPPPSNGSSTSYDTRTGNPVPTSSTSAGQPAPTPTPTPSASPTPTPTPTPTPSANPTPSPTPSAGAPAG